MAESSPYYPTLLHKCDLKQFLSTNFPSYVRQHTQERSFLGPRDKPLDVETLTPDQWCFKERSCSKGVNVKINKGNLD